MPNTHKRYPATDFKPWTEEHIVRLQQAGYSNDFIAQWASARKRMRLAKEYEEKKQAWTSGSLSDSDWLEFVDQRQQRLVITQQKKSEPGTTEPYPPKEEPLLLA